ncbi:alpha-amylase [Candidatus Fermentibacteria bacterium]|nr:alpha-amylase [Candidatus Fermentibacteria bacterium]
MNPRSRWPRKPVVYEINTRIWLADLQDRLGREVTLADVPDQAITRWKNMGIHAVWLMGVWKTSPYSAELCRASQGLRHEATEILGEFRDRDIDASPYAVAGYEIDPVLGGQEAMGALHGRMKELGVLLVLDFVPNHLAVDHPWTAAKPELFVAGTQEILAHDPVAFFSVPDGSAILAHGRDPHFPPWSDTAQLDYFKEQTHEAMTDELLRVAAHCDGVRCDMAMLLLPDVFKSVWGWTTPERTPPCFWDKAIATVRKRNPGFLFMAEVYWGLEGVLQGKGFDYTYDKTLYDHLVSRRTNEIHAHLSTRIGFHEHAMRFIENHDEPRAAAVFGKAQSKMAAAMILTLPGATLLHQGQEYGWQKRLPVQLRRRPIEPTDHDLEAVYTTLIRIAGDQVIQDGKWEMLVVEADRRQDVLAYQWVSPYHEGSLLVVLNLTSAWQTGCARATCLGSHMTRVNAHDIMTGKDEIRPALVATRVEVPFRLPPWGFKIVRLGVPGHQADDTEGRRVVTGNPRNRRKRGPGKTQPHQDKGHQI